MALGIILFQPMLAWRSCRECRDWVFDDGSEGPISTCEKATRGGKPLPRVKGAPMPCYRCPKKNPELGEAIDRTLGRARRALEMYYRTQATGGYGTPWASDPIVARNLGIVGQMVKDKEQANLIEGLSAVLVKTVLGASTRG